MEILFADTGFWIALLNVRDSLHSHAAELYKRLEADQVKIVTSEMILTELMNFFSRFGPNSRQQVAITVKQMRDHASVMVMPQTSDLFEQALDLYLQRLDKSWSLTDCASFLIMETLGITKTLAYDKHFEQAGFQVLLS